jgi:hypothetical protein
VPIEPLCPAIGLKFSVSPFCRKKPSSGHAHRRLRFAPLHAQFHSRNKNPVCFLVAKAGNQRVFGPSCKSEVHCNSRAGMLCARRGLAKRILNAKLVNRANKYQERMLGSQAIKLTLDSLDDNARNVR